jgi:putative glutamine amidotransferase
LAACDAFDELKINVDYFKRSADISVPFFYYYELIIWRSFEMRPVIGVPCQADYRAGSKRPIYGNNRAYIHAVESAGGLPILIPMLNDLRELEELLPRLDGIVFSGGIDLQPSLYGEQPHPATEEVDARLDEFEMTLANWALQEDIPVLGVCRGMQLLNVLLGGTLYQDISDQYPDALPHCRRELPRTALTHTVTIEEGTLTQRVLGVRELPMNSLHHQAVKEPGKGVRISGRSPDGIAEFLEVTDRRFVLGIQGHPEELFDTVPEYLHLFEAFVRACAHLPVAEKEPQPTLLVQANS